MNSRENSTRGRSLTAGPSPMPEEIFQRQRSGQHGDLTDSVVRFFERGCALKPRSPLSFSPNSPIKKPATSIPQVTSELRSLPMPQGSRRFGQYSPEEFVTDPNYAETPDVRPRQSNMPETIERGLLSPCWANSERVRTSSRCVAWTGLGVRCVCGGVL